MKHYYKFIYVVLVLLLSFFRSAETFRQPIKLSHCIVHDSVAADDTLFSSTGVSSDKSLEMHYNIKKKIKSRATTLEQSTIKAPYFSNLINFKIYKRSLIYGIASIYQIQRHSHLHLYQLF